jgi:hypothetical protein
MLYEHKEVDNETIHVNPSDPSAILSLNYYEDPLFAEVRYKPYHELGDVFEEKKLPFLQLENLQKNAATADERAKATKALTRQKREYDLVGRHFRMLADCHDLLDSRHLREQAEYEQAMVTGVEGQSPFKASAPVLSQMIGQHGLDVFDKVRILALYQLKGKQQSDTELTRMMESARVDATWKPAIMNVAKEIGPMFKREQDDVVVKKDRNGQPPMKTDKWIPLVAQLLTQILENKLDTKKFEVPPHDGRWQNIVIYVLGGISYMELRWLNDLRETKLKGVKLYVGASNLLTPKSFLAQLKGLTP